MSCFYVTLGSRLNSAPYSRNPLFHGYCGSISYFLWLAESEQGLSQRNTDALLQRGIDHFDKYLKLGTPNAVFVAQHVQV